MAEQYLTPDALKKLKDELEHLKTVRRRELADQLERAIDFGDISENAEFQEAKEAQAFVEGRIIELGEIIRAAKVLIPKNSTGTVQPGSMVFVSHSHGTEKFHIVSDHEANPLEGKISFESPLGMALLNKPSGVLVEVETPSGKKKYKIVKIE